MPNPVFFDPSTSRQISSAVCGSTYSMTVPGWEGQSVYLVQTLNGNAQYSGLFTVPMPAYQSICSRDVGTFQTTVYDPVSGNTLGTTTFTVLPQGSPEPQQGNVISVPTSGATTGSLLSQVTPTELLIGGGLVLFLMRKKKK